MRLNRIRTILPTVESIIRNFDNTSDISSDKWLARNSSGIDDYYITADDRVTTEIVDELNFTTFNATDVPIITEKLSIFFSPLCYNHKIPSIDEYLAAINSIGIVIFTFGALAVLLILYMYVDTLKHITKHAPPLAKANSAFVISVYPVVAIATYCAIVVPRAHLLAEAMTQGIFMASMYQLFCLFMAYCGGEAEFIERVKLDSFVLQVSPCCCCCCCLPKLPINKTNMKRLRLLVLQLPIVQGLVYMVLLVMWAEEESLYHVNYIYMQPLIILSILCGIWGMIMTITMLEGLLKQYNIRGKFLVLQTVLLLAKMQGLLARFAVWRNILPCKIPITPAVYANLIYNSFMLWEMIVLSYAARKLYKRPIIDVCENEIRPTAVSCSHTNPTYNYDHTDEKIRY